MAEISNDLKQAATLLREGKLVGIPTETVYGLAGNALDEKAILSIFEVKNRPKFDPLILHFSSLSEVTPYVKKIPNELQILIKKFTPGPITFLLEKTALVNDLITAGLSRVAIRIPAHELTLKLLQSLDFPVAAPSANPFGYVSPTTAKHVDDQLGENITYILDGGACSVGLESTIVGIENNQITIYRKGGITVEEIEAEVGEVNVFVTSSSKPSAPGMLHSHYAPKKNNLLFEFKDLKKLKFDAKKTGFISFTEKIDGIPSENQFQLSSNGNLKEAASNLFKALRLLDSTEIETLYLELVPEIGLGQAINDKLRRATNHPN